MCAACLRPSSSAWTPSSRWTPTSLTSSPMLRLIDGLIGQDLVLGSRWVEGGGIENWEASRLWLSRFGSGYARTLLGLPFRDLTGGFKVWRAATWAQIDLGDHPLRGLRLPGRDHLLSQPAGRAHPRGPDRVRRPTCGQSKMSWNIALEAAFVVPMLRWRGQ